jgi:hypothetical protein
MLAITGVIVLAMGLVLFIIPPPVPTDPAQGFQVLKSMQQGSAFNTLTIPSQLDISKTQTQFLTWWSPGQYLVPYVIKMLTGLDLGHCIALTVILAEYIGLAGFYAFFKKIGFSKNVASASLIFLICQRAFMAPHVFYNGDEILLFSFEGWFLYGCLSIKGPGLKLILFIILSSFLGFFLKSSFLWIYGTGLIYFWLRILSTRKNFTAALNISVCIGFSAAFSVLIIYLIYISKGESPAQVGFGFKLSQEALTYPMASPILSGFSLDDMLNGLMVSDTKPLLSITWTRIILLTSAIVSLLLILQIARKVQSPNYRTIVVCFYAASVLFFGYAYLWQLDISMEPRHFRIVGLLMIPGMIVLISRMRRWFIMCYGALLAVTAFFSFSYLIEGYRTNRNLAIGVTGIPQPYIDQASLDKILMLDRQNRNLTFVFVADDTGLEILHNRVIPLQPIGDDLKIDTGDYTYLGHGGPICIVLPKFYDGTKQKIILSSFPGYKNFSRSALSDYYVLLTAK